MKRIFTIPLFIALLSTSTAFSQNVGIGTNTPNSSAQLDITSSTKGFLPPRMTTTQRDAITTPAKGLMVFATTDSSYYFFDGDWKRLMPASEAWSLKGNSGTSPATHFLGTADNQPLLFKLNNQPAGFWDATKHNYFLGLSAGGQFSNNAGGGYNIGVGAGALQFLTGGFYNVGIGPFSLRHLQTGHYNVAIGYATLFRTNGLSNTAVGYSAMRNDTSGGGNNAFGAASLYNNSSGQYNTAMGYYTQYSNQTGQRNVAVGALAMYNNTIGSSNIAVGYDALKTNTTVSNLVAVGDSALFRNTTGYQLTAIGSKALWANTSGNGNTAVGFHSLYSNTTGSGNVAVGSYSLYTDTDANNLVAIGDSALFANTSGIRNTALGSKALSNNTTGSFNTAVGPDALTNNSSGVANLAMGTNALRDNVQGSGNVGIGNNSLLFHTNNDGNTAIGQASLRSDTTGTLNTGLGSFSNVKTGSLTNATVIGARAQVDCSNCLVLGSTSGVNGASSSVNVGIGTTQPVFPLDVWGRVRIRNNGGANTAGVWLNESTNTSTKGFVGMYDDTRMGLYLNGLADWGLIMTDAGNVGIGTPIPVARLSVNGNIVTSANILASGTISASAFTTTSDARYKMNINPLSGALPLVQRLAGKTYYWNQRAFPEQDLNDKKQIGFIAQEVEQVLPDAVSTDEKGFKSVNYIQVIPLLTEAVKEQQALIQGQQEKIDWLVKELIEIKKAIKPSR